MKTKKKTTTQWTRKVEGLAIYAVPAKVQSRIDCFLKYKHLTAQVQLTISDNGKRTDLVRQKEACYCQDWNGYGN